MISFEEFVTKYLGKGTDYDNAYGVQCVDLAKLYLDKCYGIKAGAWGNAHCYYDDFGKKSWSGHSKMNKEFKKIANSPAFIPKRGDICVWSTDISSGKTGHIAVATGEGTTSYFYSYDQNWGSTAELKKMRKIKHTYSCFLGVLRPINQWHVTCPFIEPGTYKTNAVRGLYKGVGASTGRFTVGAIKNKDKLTSSKASADAFYKKGSTVTIRKSELSDSGNLFSLRSDGGYIATWERKGNKTFAI